jgi:Cu/Ag efflux protein CusF
MKRVAWRTIAGLGVAGLLAAVSAYGQGGSSSTGGQMSGSQTGSGSSMGQSGSTSTGGSMGTGSQQGSTGAGAMSPTGNELTGKVQKFDRKSNELTIANSQKKLKVSDDTQVRKDGQKATLSDIKEGDQVRASFTGTGNTLQVNRIDVMSSGSMAPAGAAPGTTGTGTTTPKSKGTGTSTPPSGSSGY